MLLLNNRQLIGILSDVLGCVDSRLIDHGKRVAYIMFKILQDMPRFDDYELRNICIAALLHDIGAYKTEEIDKMLSFETIDIWEHSIYGALFLKYFSPIKELLPIVMFHHAECKEIPAMDPTLKMLAQLISLADRAEICLKSGKTMKDFREYLQKYRGNRHCDEIVDMFLESGVDIDTVFDGMEKDKGFSAVLFDMPMTSQEIDDYINMIVHLIDFRSNQTVIHTVTTACIACFLGRIYGANNEEISQLRTGAMLHDLGKISTPLNILESPNRLTEDEMEIMRMHVVVSEEILSAHIGEPIKGIAVKHHEKLTGDGYPKGLSGDELTLWERIAIVADIFGALYGSRTYKEAYPKEKCVAILQKMSDDGLIDAGIVAAVIRHYDEICAAVEEEAEPVIEAYEAIKADYARLVANPSLTKFYGCVTA